MPWWCITGCGPRANAFRYRVAYLCLGLDDLQSAVGRWLKLDRRGFVSFRQADHGARDGGDLAAWLRGILAGHGLADICDGEPMLMTLPRILGYVFNPVSFWFCRDRDGALRAVLCEVNNTFGESHCYLVHRADHDALRPDEWLDGRKVFHVSPFLPLEGSYRFRFRLEDGLAHVDVNYHDGQGLMLATSVGGRREALDDRTVLRRFLGNPTMTLAVIAGSIGRRCDSGESGRHFIASPHRPWALDTRSAAALDPPHRAVPPLNNI
jgi:DUF1365 family protein